MTDAQRGSITGQGLRVLVFDPTPVSERRVKRLSYLETKGDFEARMVHTVTLRPKGIEIAEGEMFGGRPGRYLKVTGGCYVADKEGTIVPCDPRDPKNAMPAPCIEDTIILGFHFPIHNNIGHFLADQLPIFHYEDLLWQRGYRKILILNVDSDLLQRRIRETFAVLLRHPFEVEFGPLRVRPMPLRHCLVPQDVSRHPTMKSDALRHLFDRVKPNIAPAPDRLVFVSRADAADRKLFCEPQVEAMLGQRGFETVLGSDLSASTARELFGNARLVVGVFGAALTHIAYCRPGTTVVNICAESVSGVWYASLAELFELNYLRYCGPPVENGSGARVTTDFDIDPAQLERVVDQLLLGREPGENII